MLDHFRVKIALLSRSYRTIKEVQLSLPDPDFRKKLVLIKHQYMAHIAAIKSVEYFKDARPRKAYRYFEGLHWQYVYLYFMPREAMQMVNAVIDAQKRLGISFTPSMFNKMWQLAQQNCGKRRNRLIRMLDLLYVKDDKLYVPKIAAKTAGLVFDLKTNKVVQIIE